MPKFLFNLLCILFYSLGVYGQQMTPQDYIATFKDAAIRNMYDKRIPASITLAQGMLESGNGNSKLARQGNNHFGIKCADWTGKTIRIDDDKKNECFRKYNSVQESYADHADFLSSRSRYQHLFQLDLTDYKGWAHGLKKAGYATDSRYANKLIDLIERHRLFEFDNATPSNQIAASGDKGIANGLDAVTAKTGDSKESLALRFGTKVRKIEKYNELGRGDEVIPGEVVYLQKKRKRARKGNDYHTLNTGETIYEVAQLYGIRVEALLKLNNMWYGSPVAEGLVLHLRKQKPLFGKKRILFFWV